MLYLVIETFKTPGAIEVYRRAREHGRGLPEGLEYIASWVDLDFTRCWQLMKTDTFELFDQWIDRWRDLVEFEIIPVRTSTEASEIMSSRL